MTDQKPDPEIRALVHALRSSDPESYAPDERDLLISRALIVLEDQEKRKQRITRQRFFWPGTRQRKLGQGPSESKSRLWILGWGATASALCAALIVVLAPGQEWQKLTMQEVNPPSAPHREPVPPPTSQPPSALPPLPKNDQHHGKTIFASQQKELMLDRAGSVLVSAGTTLRIEESEARIDLELEEGAILLDIDKESAGLSVVVHVGKRQVVVEGTIFSVEAAAQAFRVEVFEGKVVVETPTSTSPVAEGSVHLEGAMPRELPEVLRNQAASRARERFNRSKAEEARNAAHARALGATRFAQAREALRKGDFKGALDLAQSQLEHHPDPSWLLLAGDSARAARKTELAIAYYRQLSALPYAGARGIQGAYLAARLEAEQGHFEAALALLHESGATASSSPLAEPASLLSIGLLNTLGRRDQLDVQCERFAASFDDELPAACSRD